MGRQAERRSGRGGRGSANRKDQNKSQNKKKKTLEDYWFYVGSDKQASDFETTYEFMINFIKRTYMRGNDIAESLRILKNPDTNLWKPSLEVSLSEDEHEKNRDNRQFELDYKAEYDEYMKRKRNFEENRYKAYAELWARCNRTMKAKIEARTDYESRIYNDPIELIKAIKEHALNYEESRYEMAIIFDALKAFVNCRQREKENLQEYTKRFKVVREVLQSHLGGPIILKKFVENHDEYDANDEDKLTRLTKKADEQLSTYAYLVNADERKYGSIVKGLNSQKALKNDQFPKTMIEGNNVLSTHRFDNAKNNSQNSKDSSKNNDKNKDKNDEGPALTFVQMEGKCYCCGKAGHKSPQCYLRNKIPREEWAINKVQMTQMSKDEDDTNNKNTDNLQSKDENNEKSIGWAGVHALFLQGENDDEFARQLKKTILLDSDSNATIFCNEEYVNEIWDTNQRMELGTNGGGHLESKQKCNVPLLGEHWFNKDSMTNIIALSDMTAKFKVTMDSSKEKAFFVHLPDKVVIFKQMGNNLYGMDPSDPKSFISKEEYKNKRVHFAGVSEIIGNSEVENNLAYMSERQRKRAKMARKALQALGSPTTNDLKAMLRMNLIRNAKITTEDINLAEKAFGPDVGSLKGKITRSRPLPAQSNVIEIPTELLRINEDIVLSIDGLTVNSLKFLTTISHDVFYRTGQYLGNATADNYEDCMKEIYTVYKQGGFTITEIHCDNEFHKAMDSFAAKQDPPIRMNYATAGEHVPRAERNNRVIQERIRANYYQLPYNTLTKTLVKYMVTEASRKLNFVPAKHGISKHYSPRMILHQENIDFDRHCTHVLGEYVQAHENEQIKNNNKPRALDCLYLRPTGNYQGGHELLHLQTNRVITRHKVTSVPITPSVIKQVHTIAKMEDMPIGLKIKNRYNNILFDSSLAAGVDYSEQQFDDEIDDRDDEIDDKDYSSDENEETDNDDQLTDDIDEMDKNELGDILDQQYIESAEEVVEDEQEIEESDEEVVEDEQEIEESDEINQEENNNNDVNDSEIEDKEYTEDTETTGVRRTKREIRLPERFGDYRVHLHSKQEINRSTNSEEAVLALIMCHWSERNRMISKKKFYQMIQTYSLKKGLEKFGARGKQAAYKEMKQLHKRVVFKPVKVESLTHQERKRAMESLMFLVEKRDKIIKARTVANGSTQRPYTPKEEAASPTAATDSIFVTATVDAKQNRDVMTLDIPNAFVQTEVPYEKGDEKIIMKIRGRLVDMLFEISSEYKDYVVYENGQKVLYVQMLKALYGMMKASLMYYNKFRKDIELEGYEINPYDPCVANKLIDGKQHTVTWHVDDVKASHEDFKVNDAFHKWCEDKYGSEELGHVTAVRGKRHDYLGVNLDFSEKGKLKVDMIYYIERMMKEFQHDVKESTRAPWSDKLFKVSTSAEKLDEERKSEFHTFVMKAMFLCKRARPDILPAVCFLSTRTSEPDESDWNKLLKMMGFLKGTVNDVLTLEADDTQTMSWYIDAAFAVHHDMKSHTGMIFTLGKGALISSSIKQKVNSRSSTEAELNATDDMIGKIIWMKKFIEHQGFKVKLNVIYQDNKSTMKLINNGKVSSGKRTRHFDIKLFYITDLISRDEVTIRYCSTDKMIADYMSKPTTGSKFKGFRDLILNLSGKSYHIEQQECVGE